jgi:hypothetical protein
MIGIQNNQAIASKRERVRQVYSAYLDTQYHVEYYRTYYGRIQDNSRIFEFVIALSALLSGGSGLGILATQWMAVPCGVITAFAVIFTAAKQTFDWPGKANFCVEMVDKNGRLAGQLKILVDDIKAARSWTNEFAKSFDTLRTEIANLPQDKLPKLPPEEQNRMQTGIIESEQPQHWWKPRDAEV